MSQFRRLEAENEREYGDEFDLIMFLPVMVRLFFFLLLWLVPKPKPRIN